GTVPAPRDGHAATFIGKTMFVFGGEVGNGQCDDGLYAFNIANRTWYKVPIQGSPLMGRRGHSVAALGSSLYVFGGIADGHYLQDLAAFDVRVAASKGPRWTFIDAPGPVPPARSGHSCHVFNGRLYIFGGTAGDRCYNDLWCFDPAERRWEQITPRGAMPPPRHSHTAALVDDCLFVMGGRDIEGQVFADFFAFKFAANRWYTFPIQSSTWPSRRDAIFVVAKPKLLMLGGVPINANDTPSTIHILDTGKIRI
ncbi:galactose oxidase, partial [Ramicandelaber brevisporus]